MMGKINYKDEEVHSFLRQMSVISGLSFDTVFIIFECDILRWIAWFTWTQATFGGRISPLLSPWIMHITPMVRVVSPKSSGTHIASPVFPGLEYRFQTSWRNSDLNDEKLHPKEWKKWEHMLFVCHQKNSLLFYKSLVNVHKWSLSWHQSKYMWYYR